MVITLMNIQIQTYGLIILFMLFIFYKSHKTLNLYTEQVFMRAMYISMTNLFLDILSLTFIANMESLPLWAVKIVCKLYIISLVWESVFALVYVLTDVYSEEIHRKRAGLLYIIAGVQSLLVILLPINIHVDKNASYTVWGETRTGEDIMENGIRLSGFRDHSCQEIELVKC